MTYYSEKYTKELTDAVNKCSPEVPRLLMRFINKGEHIGTPGLPDEIFQWTTTKMTIIKINN